MSDTEREYTPTLNMLREAYADWELVPPTPGPEGDEDRRQLTWNARVAEFDRAIATLKAQVRADEREKIARAIEAECPGCRLNDPCVYADAARITRAGGEG